MSVKVFRWILVITNLILILIPITALILSYFFLIPRALDDEIDRATISLSLAFSIWACVLILTSICFLGITFTNSCCLHLISALLLAASATLAAWLVTEQFLFRDKPNWTIVGISLVAGFIWAIQVFTELLLSCVLCCTPSHPKTLDAEAAKKAEAEADAGDGHHGKRSADDGTDEEKEKLVNMYQQDHNNTHGNSHHGQTSGPGGAFVPSPQAPPIEEVDEGEDDDDDDEDEDDEEEGDSQAGIRMIDRSSNPNHPSHDHLRSIPEEKQHLLHGIGSSGSGIRPMSRTSQGSSGGQQCPLATPEDTGV